MVVVGVVGANDVENDFNVPNGYIHSNDNKGGRRAMSTRKMKKKMPFWFGSFVLTCVLVCLFVSCTFGSESRGKLGLVLLR